MMHAALRLVLPAVLAAACSEATTELIGELAAPGARGDAAIADAATAVDAAAADTDGGPKARCRGRACQCDNDLDEDGDALVDGLDPECTGPFDDDESSFATGIRSGGGGSCRDCYWDGNSGSGDDGCSYHVDCLSGDTVANPDDACSSCEVSSQCASTCGERTPSGCDCFGCCEVSKDNGDVVSVLLSESCSTENLDDPRMCPACTPNPSCRNECERCELCPGRRREDLPADCPLHGGRPSNVCDEERQVCDESRPCRTDFYCLLGCCQYVVQ
jgi:hypothetical protein